MKIASIVAISSRTSGEKIQTMLRSSRSRLSRVSATSTVTPAQREQPVRTEATRTSCPAITASKARPPGYVASWAPSCGMPGIPNWTTPRSSTEKKVRSISS